MLFLNATQKNHLISVAYDKYEILLIFLFCFKLQLTLFATPLTLLLLSFLPRVFGDLPFKHTSAVACLPMDITFDRIPEGYPYIVWIIGIGAGIYRYSIKADYPVNEPFQYLVPAKDGFANVLHIAISDSLGNGSSCGYLRSIEL